jgi:hypothetical protein
MVPMPGSHCHYSDDGALHHEEVVGPCEGWRKRKKRRHSVRWFVAVMTRGGWGRAGLV